MVDLERLLSYRSETEEKAPTKDSVFAFSGRDFVVCYA